VERELHTLIRERTIYCLAHHRALHVPSAVREELMLLADLAALQIAPARPQQPAPGPAAPGVHPGPALQIAPARPQQPAPGPAALPQPPAALGVHPGPVRPAANAAPLMPVEVWQDRVALVFELLVKATGTIVKALHLSLLKVEGTDMIFNAPYLSLREVILEISSSMPHT
jgi:hypothetical protein